MTDARPYIIRQGDYLQSIAWTHGVPANQVWSHARNKDLRAERTDPNLLHPGDVLFIPPRARGAPSLRLGAENCYRSMVARVTVKVAFQDASGRPLAGTPFVVEGIAAPIHGTTDASGVVSFDAPVDCGSVVLRLPEHQRALRVDIGHLDPIAEESGLRARPNTSRARLDPGAVSVITRGGPSYRP